MGIDPNRREMFADLYRLAEYYENPPFRHGDVEGNANWFLKANDEALYPFFKKYPDDQLAGDLAIAIVDNANRKALEANKQRAGGNYEQITLSL